MSEQALNEIITNAVADYGFRLAAMWGPDDVISMGGLSADEARAMKSVIVPELKKLPDPVEPKDRAAVTARLIGLVSKKDQAKR